MRTLVDETAPVVGKRQVSWDRRDDNGEIVRPGIYIDRVTIDDEATSRVFTLR
jgi:hypothetical protein